MSAVCSIEPASARPMPSSKDFFPRSITPAGISASWVRNTKSATYLVTPVTCGNGGGQGEVVDASADPGTALAHNEIPAPALIEVRKKVRRFIYLLTP